MRFSDAAYMNCDERSAELQCNPEASCSHRRLQQRRVFEDCGVLRPQRGPLDLHRAHADSEGSISDGCSHGTVNSTSQLPPVIDECLERVRDLL